MFAPPAVPSITPLLVTLCGGSREAPWAAAKQLSLAVQVQRKKRGLTMQREGPEQAGGPEVQPLRLGRDLQVGKF